MYNSVMFYAVYVYWIVKHVPESFQYNLNYNGTIISFVSITRKGILNDEHHSHSVGQSILNTKKHFPFVQMSSNFSVGFYTIRNDSLSSVSI